MTDPDLLAVRRLAPEPTDESVSRSWYRITQMEAKRHRPSRLPWLRPALAAFAVVVLAAASITVVRVGPGALWPVASTPEAIDTLHALANAAASGPTAPQLTEGQLVLVKSEGLAGACSPTTCTLEPELREVWYDPALAMLPRKILAGETQLRPSDRDNLPEDIAKVQDILARQGPSLRWPTPQWLAGLPTDSHELLAQLRRDMGDHENWTVDHQLWDAMGELYLSGAILMSPPLRAALLRSFTGMSGLSVRHITVDARQLVAIRQTDGDSGNEIIFDPQSGLAVGRGNSFAGVLAIVQPSEGQPLDPGVIYQSIWEQSVVDGI